MHRKCKSCHAFDPNKDISESFGKCRLRSVHPFPPRAPSEWCLEHVQRPKDKKAEKEAERKELSAESKAYRDVIDCYYESFKAKFGRKPNITGMDGSAAKSMIKAHPVEEIRSVIKSFFNETPEWNTSRRAFGLSSVAGAWNSIVARDGKRSLSGAEQEGKHTFIAKQREDFILNYRQEALSDSWPSYLRHLTETGEEITFKEYYDEFINV